MIVRNVPQLKLRRSNNTPLDVISPGGLV